MVNWVVKVVINGLPFSISMVEEWGGGVCRSCKDASKVGDDDVDSSVDDDLSNGMYSGTGDFLDDVDIGEDELNDLFNAVKISGKVDPQLMNNNLNSFVNHSDDLVGKVGESPPVGGTPFRSKESFVAEPIPPPVQRPITPWQNAQGLELPSILNKPIVVVGQVRKKKQRKLLKVGEQ